MRVITRENRGLEWGAYALYLAQTWTDGETLFLHDDTRATVETLLEVFTTREARAFDLAFVFPDADACQKNGGHHGRAWIASARYLDRLHRRGGVWFDAENQGNLIGRQRNRGSHHFMATAWCLGEEDPSLRFGTIIHPSLDLGFRGALGVVGAGAAAEFFTVNQQELTDARTYSLA